MNIKLNEKFNDIKETYLFAETASRTKKYEEDHPDKEVIRLGIGDVTLPLSESVVEALKKASEEMGCKDSVKGYPAYRGYGFLQEAILRRYKSHGVDLTLDAVFVSDGAKSDIGNIVDILGDNNIIIPDPVYPVYVDSNLMSGRKITLVPGNIDNGFLPMPSDIPSPVEGPSVIYICSPNNPTGAAYSHDGLKTWVDYALQTGSLIIFDSAYEAFITDDTPHTIYEVEGAKECAIEICSFSKFAGFTGLRCGWTIVPEELMAGTVSINKMWYRRQSTKFNGVSYPVQRAAEAALTDKGMMENLKNIEYYRNKANMIEYVLDKKGIRYTGGKNSPYIWLKCPDGMGSWEFFDKLLNEANIAGTPGEGFGESGEGFFRLTAFGTTEATKKACERLMEFL